MIIKGEKFNADKYVAGARKATSAVNWPTLESDLIALSVIECPTSAKYPQGDKSAIPDTDYILHGIGLTHTPTPAQAEELASLADHTGMTPAEVAEAIAMSNRIMLAIVVADKATLNTPIWKVQDANRASAFKATRISRRTLTVDGKYVTFIARINLPFGDEVKVADASAKDSLLAKLAARKASKATEKVAKKA